MSELKSFDENVVEEDEYETPPELYKDLCKKYDISPELDVCADALNKKCDYYFDMTMDGLYNPWRHDVWCNPPHSITEKFVRRAKFQWKKYNINIMMIIPTNTMSSIFWHECIEDIAEYHAIKGRPRFLQNGKKAPHISRNAYVCVIWRKVN